MRWLSQSLCGQFLVDPAIARRRLRLGASQSGGLNIVIGNQVREECLS
ncbi:MULTISPECIES: hypothetical protein [unclassified Nostoc]|nr:MULTISPECIES: hypothetical protein [unclassified Nostoc]MDZ8125682.1 hypothetical protein [Nostoc sp. CmiVER01]MDZ8228000.1 hypothetical protein [Nostoc sp. ChiVER01]